MRKHMASWSVFGNLLICASGDNLPLVNPPLTLSLLPSIRILILMHPQGYRGIIIHKVRDRAGGNLCVLPRVVNSC